MTPPAISSSTNQDHAAEVVPDDVNDNDGGVGKTFTDVSTTKNGDDGDGPVVLKRTVIVPSSPSRTKNDLTLLFLGCESQPPYGPHEHTATLFLDLICRSIQQDQRSSGATADSDVVEFHVSLRVYRASQGRFPTQADIMACDGVILPGSYNSAYDVGVDWIERLKMLIQQQLVGQKVPTLGVCFGHQIYAQSFHPQGRTTKCPAGSQAGRKPIQLTSEGRKFLQTLPMTTEPTDTLDLFYSHGDMVSQLPPNAASLGGNDKVPIQAAIYYDSDVPTGDDTTDKAVVAVTFQAHPEYGGSSTRGLNETLLKIIQLMSDRGDITDDDCQHALKDSQQSFKDVERQSIDVMTISGKLLGWF
jgi:GMP synthase-like glutamine amidotransferase